MLVGAPAGGFEQLWGEVEADDLRAGHGSRDRDVAGAGRHVEHLVARPQVDVGEQVARRRLVDQLGDGRVVPSGPGRTVCALQISDSGHDLRSPLVVEVTP
jgi:hypothetical protein